MDNQSFNNSSVSGYGNEEVYQVYVNIAAILYEHGVRQVVLSPGSRSAPLAITLIRHGGFNWHVLVDERSAAFTALGIAQATSRPVAMVCTSGTAAMNYGPAIAEAFFQCIPLLAFTADRPPEWINQGENQTIFQEGIYGQNLKGTFSLPVNMARYDSRKDAYRKVNNALNLSLAPSPGPVHLNAPFREPLYPAGALPQPSHPLPFIRKDKARTKIFDDELAYQVKKASRILILAGLHPPDSGLKPILEKWTACTNGVLVPDPIANLHEVNGAINKGEQIFTKALEENDPQLQPELLITFGGGFVSKAQKSYLRQNPPKAHWHIDPGGHEQDLFQVLTRVIWAKPRQFFEEGCAWLDQASEVNAYKANFQQVINSLGPTQLSEQNGGGVSELAVVQSLLTKLPKNAVLQLGNSQPVRHVNYLGLDKAQLAKGITVLSNRGTSGIDGSVSTAVGYAMCSDKQVVLLVGDLAFMYDRNGLWNQDLPDNISIVILNNKGGGIFRNMEGPSMQKELEPYFASRQNLHFQATAQQHGCFYQSVERIDELEKAFDHFVSREKNGPAIIEVACKESTIIQ